MTNETKGKKLKCATCLKYINLSQKQRFVRNQMPDFPWQNIASDMFEHKGKVNYLYWKCEDYYLRLLEYHNSQITGISYSLSHLLISWPPRLILPVPSKTSKPGILNKVNNKIILQK